MEFCGATLSVGDDYGDNDTTFHCQLPYKHEGNHQDIFRKGNATLTWIGDDRSECVCGHEEYLHYVTFICDKNNSNIVREEIRGGCTEGSEDYPEMILSEGEKEAPKSEGQCPCQKYQRYDGPRKDENL